VSRTTALREKDRSTGRLDFVYAGQGAVRQTAGTLKVYVCNACGTEVVWAESKRTGRRYLVNVSKGYLGQRYYVGANVHKCEEILARRAAEESARIEDARKARQWIVGRVRLPDDRQDDRFGFFVYRADGSEDAAASEADFWPNTPEGLEAAAAEAERRNAEEASQ
jgi:hypothetical protein